MNNARLIQVKNIGEAKEEIRKIGADAASIPWMAPKCVHMLIKLEDVPVFAANIIKQEMLAKGGDAAVNRGTVNCSVEKTDVLLMGTYSQMGRLVYKLGIQQGILKSIGDEIQKILKGFDVGKPQFFECGRHKLAIGEKTYVMGILNVTPDSFSDGGKYNNIEAAVKRAQEMVAEGADIIDVGGESTRPGHTPVDEIEEANRVIPVVEKLSEVLDVPISVDTSKASVAEKSLKAGADIINDGMGLQRDPAMANVVARSGAGVVLMHNQQGNDYNDLMGDIIKFLRKSIEIAEKAGISPSSMVVDPGIGFGKNLDQNLEVMRRLKELDTLNLPVLLGTSRKSMIGYVLDLPADERLEGTAATVTIGIANGVDIVRVHDVKEITRVVRMTDAVVRK